MRTLLNTNQWKNSYSVIEWFKKIDDKANHMFLSFDIIEFYPSISKELLDNVLNWAKSLTSISDDDITIIQHTRKSLLFMGVTPWAKRNTDSLFDITMGSFDGAEISELVGLFILKVLLKRNFDPPFFCSMKSLNVQIHFGIYMNIFRKVEVS